MKTVSFQDEIIPGAAQRDLGLSDDEMFYQHVSDTGSDHTLCGLAYGEYTSGYREGKITCGNCIGVINFCKSFRKGRDY